MEDAVTTLLPAIVAEETITALPEDEMEIDRVDTYLTETQMSITTGFIILAVSFWAIGYLLNFVYNAPVRKRTYRMNHEDNEYLDEEMSFVDRAIETITSWVQ